MRRVRRILIVFFTFFMVADATAQVVPRPKRRGRRYSVRIESAPPGATVYLDQEIYGAVGVTPWQGKIQTGDWKVILKKDGYEIATRYITVRRTRKVQETFVPMVKKEEPTVLDIRGDADPNALGSEVWVDGQLQGKVPMQVKVNPGRHLIAIKREGFENFSTWVTAEANHTITVNPRLTAIAKKEVGSILVDADVAGADVLIDGKAIEGTQTPALIPDLVAGPHVIEVRKAPAMPWKQTVVVKAGETVKVRAELQASTGPTGTVRVLSNVTGAKVYLDGAEVGAVPADVRAKPGEHLIEVKAPNHKTREERVKVSAGSALVLKLDLRRGGGTDAVLKIVSPIPDAAVYVDGEQIGKVPQTREVGAGDHYVVVTKKGYQEYKKKLRIESGQTVTITADLSAAGGFRFLSNPAGAIVLLDGEAVGKTPLLRENIAAGEHVVTVRAEGYHDFEKSITVSGGKLQVINATLEMIDTGPTSAELRREQRGLTSRSARPIPRGRSTVDIAVGYPYFLDGRITVGAGKLANHLFDAGVFFRTFFSRSELGVAGRLQLFDRSPFALAVFSDIGGGSNFIDDSGRNSFFFDAGVVASLSALSHVTVSGRAYLNTWSDRHCPVIKNGAFEGDPVDLCTDYQARAMGGNPAGFSAEDKAHVDELLDGGDLFSREGGVRAIISVAVEAAIKQRWSLWLLFEGAPFQKERPAFTDTFNGALFEDDLGSYFRVGTTFKF
ncbi:MAG TPA: PEGA domain-containing protein [Kofleriaceae bacterium]|nr:PEGA domain-containing protein [Kofleriaceae bacterium]